MSIYTYIGINILRRLWRAEHEPLDLLSSPISISGAILVPNHEGVHSFIYYQVVPCDHACHVIYVYRHQSTVVLRI